MKQLEKEVGTFTYSKLAGPDRGRRCIAKAKIWLKTRYQFCKRDISKIDYKNKIIREIIIKRAAYELYSMSEQEIIAQDKKEDALELLAGVLGPQVYQSVYSEPPTTAPIPKPVVATVKKKSKWDDYAK